MGYRESNNKKQCSNGIDGSHDLHIDRLYGFPVLHFNVSCDLGVIET